MNYNTYFNISLQTHLFFDRIMKEHALFLELSFPSKNSDLKQTAKKFQEAFDKVLQRVIILANNNIFNSTLKSGIIITQNTLSLENMTNRLLGVNINTEITKQEQELNPGNFNVNKNLVDEISNINKETLLLIQNFIAFKKDVLDRVLSCNLYTTNYPSLIKHILDEAKAYFNILSKINKGQLISKNEQNSQELFWNDIMKEHAEFIRGLLDPSEKNLILTADKFAEEYQVINKSYNNPIYLKNASLKETINFRDFKIKGEEGILNCKIKSIIVPLLADHVLREANYYIDILNNI